MESDWEMETTEHLEDRIFHQEAARLRKVLESRQRWHWLPWVHAVPSAKEKIRTEHSEFGKLRRCWQVGDENLYIAEHGGILYRDAAGRLVIPLSFREHDPRIGWLTDKMREMRKMRKNLS